MTEQIHIVDAPAHEQTEEPQTVEDVEVRQTSSYAHAEELDPWSEYQDVPEVRDDDVDRFIRELSTELGKQELRNAIRRVDSLDVDETDDVDLAELLVFPDESLLFIGSDPTARDAIPLFGFIVEAFAPIPKPTTAEDALDLLRPEEIRAAFEDDVEDEPARQGEWWLLPTLKVPVGTVFKPGVKARPFGPSPLGNHVPREWGMTVSDDAFMAGVRELVDELPASIDTPPEVVEWADRQLRKVPVPEYAPTWEEIQELAGDILVRGTLRHRENDHFVEHLGETWHTAQTHDMDVYTGDDYLERVVLD